MAINTFNTLNEEKTLDSQGKTHSSQGGTMEQQKELDHNANILKKSVQIVMKEISNALTLAEQMQLALIAEELPEWKKRQQVACIGGPHNTCLEQLCKAAENL
ncbi:hypothetical protein G5714_009884 [Onychostoma macrolepis]|uniref:STAT transcription factor all-alpha domain-containing protein n=1 Tax=Onychostoma macrolepis TaxID=369639 RepID=A0A7J6CNQ9_9TELE|nr:hypothetical protein G5714_009884 [Onychostoma macrolepis]